MNNPKHEIDILPFKAHRDRPLMPFKPGQGVSLAGWQFAVKLVRKNGELVLKCMGKIIQQSEFANVPVDKPASTVIKTQKEEEG